MIGCGDIGGEDGIGVRLEGHAHAEESARLEESFIDIVEEGVASRARLDLFSGIGGHLYGDAHTNGDGIGHEADRHGCDVDDVEYWRSLRAFVESVQEVEECLLVDAKKLVENRGVCLNEPSFFLSGSALGRRTGAGRGLYSRMGALLLEI